MNETIIRDHLYLEVSDRIEKLIEKRALKIGDKLRRERRPRFDYKRPLFQCNDFAVKKRTMLKIRVASPRIECSVTAGLPTSGRYERRGWHRLRPAGGSAALPGTLDQPKACHRKIPSRLGHSAQLLHARTLCQITLKNYAK